MSDQPTPPTPDDVPGAAPQPGQPPAEGQPTPSAANAAARALGGRATVKGKGQTTELLKGATEKVSQTMSDKDRSKVAIVICVILLLTAVIAVIIMRKPATTSTQATVNVPEFNVALSSTDELRAFTSKYGSQMTDVQRALKELLQTTQALATRQADNESFVKEVLKQTREEMAKDNAERFKRLEDFAKLTAAPAPKDPRTKAILDQFRETLANLKESPAEAKAHAAQLLKQAGYTDDEIRNALAKAAQDAGRISVGDIAEPPVSPQEIATLPAWAQPLVSTVHQRLETIGLTEGRVFPVQVTGDVKDLLRVKARDHLADLTAENLMALATVARVRRQNLTQDLEDLIPFLVTVRDQAHVQLNDLPGIASVVWRAHDRFPDQTTPGQILSLCHVVARVVGATSADSGAFRPIDESAVALATEVVTTAVVNAIALGKKQDEQYEVASRALANYLDTSRLSATEEQRRQIALRSMAAAAARRQPPGGAPAGKADAPVAKAPEVREVMDTSLYFGPLRVDRLRVQRALVFAIPALMAANGLELRGAKGAAALVTAVEQVPRLVGDALPSYVARPLGGKDFFQVVLPEVLYAIRMGDSLGALQLPVSTGKTLETGREAELVRGAVVGAIYGPLVHDEAKAKAAAQTAMGPLEENPPLTPAAAAAIAKIPDDRPIQAIVAAYDAARPGRFGYPGERYQDLVGVMARELASAREIRDRVAALFLPNQSGLYDESVRVLIPLSLAVHDEIQIPVKDVAALVHKDLLDYTAQFLSEGRVSQQTLEVLIPKYAAAMSEESGGGSALVQTAMAVVPTVVSDLMTSKSPRVQIEVMGDIVAGLTDEALPVVEARLVQEVVLGRVLPRIKRSGALSDKDSVQKATQAVFKRVHEVVVPAYTPARIDAWSTQLTEESRQILLGAGGAGGVAAAAPGPGGPRKSLWPVASMVPATSGGQLVGTTVSTVRTRQILIPAASYGNAHVQTGVDAEIGGRSNVPVLLQVDFDWVGPANSRLVMRGCRLTGTANAMAGPQRVAIDLKQLSFVFPDGREVREDVKGFVSDNLSGEYGALGVFHWNIDRIALPAVISGAAKGFGEALKQNGQTTVVGTATATTVASEGKTLQQAIGAGIGDGFGVLSDFAQSVIKDTHASVSMVNGQRLSVVLLEPVVLHVPEDEFALLTGGAGTGFAP